MSQENVELFNRALAAMNDRDFDAFAGLMADDVEATPRIAASTAATAGLTGSAAGGPASSMPFPISPSA